MYTESEKRFLMSENQSYRWADITSMNVPEPFLSRILEHRARQAGSIVLSAHREQQKASSSLEAQISASKLW